MSDAELADRPGSWPVSASRQAYQGPWVIGVRADVVHRPGREGDPGVSREVLEHPGAVIVLAVDDRERACCLRQYRHPARGTFVEIPAGIRDAAGEPPVETAKRELREEVELAASEWRELFTLRPSAGLTEETHTVFLARGLSHADRGDFELEHEEAEMEVFWAPVSDLVDAVLAGRVTEEPLAVAVLAYDRLRSRGEL